jgi:SAM-dependent methyltransferase
MDLDQFNLHAELEDHHWWFRARRQVLKELIHRTLPVGGSVIDIGCGTGGNINTLAGDYPCLGLDASAEAIDLARVRFPGTEFLCASIPVELPSALGRPRLFLLADVLEHVPDDARFLRDLISMLTPGDHLLLTVPADMSLWSSHDVSYGHCLRYDMPRLEKAWEGLPLERLLLSYFNTRLYPLARAARAFSRWRRQAWGKAGTDLRLPFPWLNRLLERIFSGEATTLVELLEGRRTHGYAAGVSLIALLRRKAEGPPSLPATQP